MFIYTHKSFEIGYNNEQVIMVNLTAENPRPLTPGTELEFTYSVKW